MKKKIDLLYQDDTKKIISACYEVWKKFGGAFKEKVVDNSLNIALKDKGLEVENQKRIDIYFRGKKVGTYIPDKIINQKIIIELKSKPFLTREDVKQFWLYLKGSEYKVGLLVNFGPKKLEIKRHVYDEARQR